MHFTAVLITAQYLLARLHQTKNHVHLMFKCFCRDASVFSWDTMSEHAYKQAMYLAVGIGTLLLGINIW